MSMQKFYANPSTRCEYPNGSIGYGPGGPFDCLGGYARVNNCPIVVDGKIVRRVTCYATGHADTWFSIPACTRVRGKYVGGYLTRNDSGLGNGIEFRPYDRYKPML